MDNIKTIPGMGYCATFTQAGTVHAVMSDGSKRLLVSASEPGQVAFVAISGEVSVSDDNASIIPFKKASLSAVGGGNNSSGGGSAILIDQLLDSASANAVSGKAVAMALDARVGANTNYADSALNVDGRIYSSNGLSTSGNLNVVKAATIGGSLTCSSLATFDGGAVIYNYLEVNNDEIDSRFTGSLNIGNSLCVDAADGSYSTFGGNVSVAGQLSGGGVYGGYLYSSGDLRVKKKSYLEGFVELSGDLYCSGLAAFDGDVGLNGSSYFYGNSFFYEKATFTDEASFSSNVDVTGSITQGGNKVATLPDLSALLPVGSIVPSLADAMAGYMRMDGAYLLSRTAYPELFAAVGTKFGSDDAGLGFYLPDMSGRTLWGADATSPLGTTLEAGLPDVRGSMLAFAWGDGDTYEAITSEKQSEAVLASGTAQYRNNVRFRLRASDYNSIYGASSTVQPPAVAVNYFIRTGVTESWSVSVSLVGDILYVTAIAGIGCDLEVIVDGVSYGSTTQISIGAGLHTYTILKKDTNGCIIGFKQGAVSEEDDLPIPEV